jgi:hypothetical protein
MGLVEIGDYLINTRYLQYSYMAPGGVVITFGEGTSTRTITVTPEQWQAFKQSLSDEIVSPTR